MGGSGRSEGLAAYVAAFLFLPAIPGPGTGLLVGRTLTGPAFLISEFDTEGPSVHIVYEHLNQYDHLAEEGRAMKIVLSNTGKEPIYEQIKRQIKESILRGELKEEAPLPSIRQLARDLRISVITTKRAYDELEKEGLITSVVGKGSFVAGQNRTFLREKRLKWVEERLVEIVAESKALDISLEELKEMLTLLYEEQ